MYEEENDNKKQTTRFTTYFTIDSNAPAATVKTTTFTSAVNTPNGNQRNSWEKKRNIKKMHKN